VNVPNDIVGANGVLLELFKHQFLLKCPVFVRRAPARALFWYVAQGTDTHQTGLIHFALAAFELLAAVVTRVNPRAIVVQLRLARTRMTLRVRLQITWRNNVT